MQTQYQTSNPKKIFLNLGLEKSKQEMEEYKMCITDLDWDGEMDYFQNQLKEKGITKEMLNMDNYVGLTASELQSIVNNARRKVKVPFDDGEKDHLCYLEMNGNFVVAVRYDNGERKVFNSSMENGDMEHIWINEVINPGIADWFEEKNLGKRTGRKKVILEIQLEEIKIFRKKIEACSKSL